MSDTNKRNILRREIYVGNDVGWCLNVIVKGMNLQFQTDELRLPDTVDGLADNILRQWVQSNYPEVLALLRERQGMDEKAILAVQQNIQSKKGTT